MKRFLSAATLIAAVLLTSACGSGNADMMKTNEGYVYIEPPNGNSDCTDFIAGAASTDCKKVILGAGTFSVDGDLVIDCDVEISAGTKINVSESGSLTVNGDFFAGKRKIFSGSGEIRLNMPETYGYVDWFLNTVRENPNDHTALLQKAFDSMSRFYVTDEGYKISEITITKPVSVTGLGTHRVPINAKTGVNTLFTVRSSDVSFENLRIDMSGAGGNGICFYFDTSEEDYRNFGATDIFVDGAYTAFADADGEGTLDGLSLSGITMNNARGTQLLIRDVSGLKLIDFAVLRRHGAGVSCNMPGVVIENAENMYIEHLDVNGDWADEGTDGHGAVFRNCKNGSLKTIIMEYVCGSGVIIENCSDLDIENLQAYTIKNVGIYIDGLKDSAATVVRVTNGGEADQVSKRENYFLKNCSNVVFDSVISNFAYGEGMVIEKCSDMTINSFIYSEVRESLDAFALLDGGENQNVVINGFADQSASSLRKDRSVSLTGDGITVNSALLAKSKYREQITGDRNGGSE